MKRIAVVFPGIGYTVDKPLLYYSSKLLHASGWDVTPVSYSGFPDGVKGNSAKMEQAARMALDRHVLCATDHLCDRHCKRPGRSCGFL